MPEASGGAPVPVAERRPRLAAGVRLQFDPVRERWMLLSPERVIETEGPVREILQRCDGARTVADIVDELAELFTADRQEIETDVTDLLTDMAGKRLVLLR